MKSYRTSTFCVHDGEAKALVEGAVVAPIYQTSTYLSDNRTNDYHQIRYLRTSTTPNHELLNRKFASLEGAESALVTASGMAAIATATLGLLKSGDRILAQDCLYGGSKSLFVKDLPELGISVDFIDLEDPESWKKSLRSETKMIYVESVTNPLMQIGCLKEVIEFALESGLISVVDNTIASSYNFRPIEFGFDLSLYSATKYHNGHSDIVAGVIAGKSEYLKPIKRRLDHLGASLDPNSCFLLNRGLKTYVLRMRAHNENALKVAGFLENHPGIEKLFYPGLESHPSYNRAKEWFSGFSGMMSFEVKGGLEAAKRFLSALKIPLNAPSLGGVESLITRPATTSHSGVAKSVRESMGVTDSLIRLSVGIEDHQDLIEDLDQALKVIEG